MRAAVGLLGLAVLVGPEQPAHPDEELPDMVKLGNALANGQTKRLARPWVENAGKVVLQQDPKNVAEVKNLTLGLLHTATGLGNFLWRWRITYGLGGAVNQFVCDAPPLQQMSLSADRLTVEVFTSSMGAQSGVPYSIDNNQEVTASAFFGQGLTATSSPTFSEVVSAPASTVTNISRIPAGAVALRLGGSFIDPANNIRLVLSTESGTQIDSVSGAQFAASGIDAFLPLGAAGLVQIANLAAGPPAAVAGLLQWSLDF